MLEALQVLIFVGGYILVMRYLLPRLGVPT
jgi:hypothetical protein